MRDARPGGRGATAGGAAGAGPARTVAPEAVARRHVLSAGAAGTVALLAACAVPLPLDGPGWAERPAPVPDWITVRATEADHLGRIELAAGASFAVSLRAPGTAGAGWVVTRVPSHVAQTGRFAAPVWPPEAPRSATAPAPVWQVFVFEARRPGEDTLVVELAGGEAPVGRGRRVEIRVGVVAR